LFIHGTLLHHWSSKSACTLISFLIFAVYGTIYVIIPISASQRCIASPVFDENGEAVTAVSVSGPTLRLGEERLPHLGKIVRRTARAISAEIGGGNSRSYSSDLESN
jgi:hypothetical protein